MARRSCFESRRSGLTVRAVNGFQPLPERILQGAERNRSLTFSTNSSKRSVTWRQACDSACALATELAARGVGPGERLVVLTDRLEAQVALMTAGWLAGACVVVLPTTGTLSQALLLQRLKQVAPALVVADSDEWLGDFPAANQADLLEKAQHRPPARFELPHVPLEAPAILQYTSGSTGAARPVVVSHLQLAANHAAIVEAAQVHEDMVFGSWLPLFHDMGLVGFCLLQMCMGADLILSDPVTFSRNPRSWMAMVEEHHVNVTGGPNAAYHIAALSMRPGTTDLSSLLRAFNGSQSIDPQTVRLFLAAGASNKLMADAMFCVYGLAEATLAVTFPSVERGFSTTTSGPGGLDRCERVRLGRPIGDTELRIVGSDDAGVGEIELRGSSITNGYFSGSSMSDLHTADGWLRTGDLGYLDEGDLVVVGRHRDVIIVAGRNIYPEEIEQQVCVECEVRQGSVAAFRSGSSPLGDELIVAVEVRRRGKDLTRSAIARAVRDAVGINPADVVFVPRGSLPRTSSGKLRREECRSRYRSGELAVTLH